MLCYYHSAASWPMCMLPCNVTWPVTLVCGTKSCVTNVSAHSWPYMLSVPLASAIVDVDREHVCIVWSVPGRRCFCPLFVQYCPLLPTVCTIQGSSRASSRFGNIHTCHDIDSHMYWETAPASEMCSLRQFEKINTKIFQLLNNSKRNVFSVERS